MRYEPLAHDEEVELTPLEKVVQTLKTNKPLLYGLIGGGILIVLIIGIILVVDFINKRYEEDAWASLSLVTNNYKEGGVLTKGLADDYILELQVNLDDYPKAATAPWVLYELGNQHFFKGDVETAKGFYQRIRGDYPDHYLSNPEKHWDGKPPKAIRDVAKCNQEAKWLANNPEWMKPVEDELEGLEELDNSVTATVDTNKGFFNIQFYKNKAPKTVENFINLCNKGFYDGCLVARIVPKVLIMAGDGQARIEEEEEEKEPEEKEEPGGEEKEKSSDKIEVQPIELEISNVKHLRGSLSMSRAEGTDKSDGSQFFICLSPQPEFDESFTVFGRVVEGLPVVSEIGLSEVSANRGDEADVFLKPLTDIYINSIRIQKEGEAPPENKKESSEKSEEKTE